MKFSGGLFLCLILAIVFCVGTVGADTCHTREKCHTETETYYENEPYEIEKETVWDVTWKTLTGDRKWGAVVGTSTFPSTFLEDWGRGEIYREYDDYIGFDATAEINAPVSGLYHFKVGSDDGTELYVDGELIIDNWRDQAFRIKEADINLAKGKHSLLLRYYDIGSIAKLLFEADRELFSWTETETKKVAKTREITKCEPITECKSSSSTTTTVKKSTTPKSTGITGAFLGIDLSLSQILWGTVGLLAVIVLGVVAYTGGKRR